MAQDYLQKRVQAIKDPGKRKSEYYKLQREQAEEGGDQAQTDKIYGKLGKKSHNVDSDRGNKAILGAVPLLAGAPEALAGKEAIGAGRAALGAGERALAKRGGGEIEGAVQRLRTPTPVKRALGKGQVKMNAGGPHTPKAVAPARPSAISTGKNRAITSSTHPAAKSSTGPRLTGTKSSQKSLPSSGHGEWHAEVTKQTGRKLPSQPKTFNRNGTKRAEGRQKSDRNPVSARAKPKSTAKSKHMDKWSQ